MYKVLFFSFLLFIATTYAQDYTHVDSRVRNYPEFVAVTDLGYRIMNDFETETQRVRAAFIWLTHNIAYEDKMLFLPEKKLAYRSKAGKQLQVERLVQSKMDRAFRARKGVCIDYSLLLNALCEQFGLPSRVVSGIAKTEIKDVQKEPMFKNHAWNAVRIAGEWKLMDPTWASGHVDLVSKQFVRKYRDHYFFTPPSDFVKHHLPSKPEWQLLDKPMSAAAFYSAPLYLPDYFGKGIVLAATTNGILNISDTNRKVLHFDKLPKNREMYYTISGSPEFRRMGFKKLDSKAYISKIRLRKKLKKTFNYLTIYLDYNPILNFKIEE